MTVMTYFTLLLGLIIYTGYGLWGLVYLLAASGVSYAAARLTARFSWVVWVSIALNAGMLLLLKFQYTLGLALAAPLGVSYFTLQLTSYNADVARGKYPAEKNFPKFLLYISYFPHLFMGPIEKYPDFQRQWFADRRFSMDGLFDGAVRCMWGLFKMIVIAPRAGMIIGSISADPQAYQGAFALCAMVLYSLQLYCDFSGCIDIVLGVSKILGVSLSENFNTPFLSETVQEFWTRWHMTLGRWLRDYIYIPLGGNRKGTFRKGFNVIVTFLVSGLWHGTQYVLWGLFNGILVLLSPVLRSPSKILNRTLTFLLISFLWCFFIWPDAMTALRSAGSVFTVFNYRHLIPGIAAMGLTVGDWITLGASVVVLGVGDLLSKPLSAGFSRIHPAAKTAVICTMGLIVLVFGMYGLGFQAEAFIYSRF